MLEKMETSIDNYRRKFAVMRHQQGLIYQEYADEKKVRSNKLLVNWQVQIVFLYSSYYTTTKAAFFIR